MADKKHGTGIEWTHGEGYKGETWNPTTGCSKVSPGCAHCYAETLALGKLKGKVGYPGLPWTPENAATNVVLRPERLDQPLRWGAPRMIFVNSMSDVFHENIPDEYLDKVFAVMARASQHVFQVLTKRPERMRRYLNDHDTCVHLDLLLPSGITEWPLPNVWLGTSIENRHFVGRADVLRETPAAIRFISAEPLLGPLIAPMWKDNAPLWETGKRGPQLDLTGIDWLIVGGESGPGFRRMKSPWVRDLRDAAREAGVAFFFKQIGGLTPKAGGRILDGREWNEMPTRVAAGAML